MNSLLLNILIICRTTLCNRKICAGAAGIKSLSVPCTYPYRDGRPPALGQKRIKIRLKYPKIPAAAIGRHWAMLSDESRTLVLG
jgi:hypothetical protein